MVAEVVEQSPVFAEALLQPRAVIGAELLHSLLWRTASDHGLHCSAAIFSRPGPQGSFADTRAQERFSTPTALTLAKRAGSTVAG